MHDNVIKVSLPLGGEAAQTEEGCFLPSYCLLRELSLREALFFFARESFFSRQNRKTEHRRTILRFFVRGDLTK